MLTFSRVLSNVEVLAFLISYDVQSDGYVFAPGFPGCKLLNVQPELSEVVMGSAASSSSKQLELNRWNNTETSIFLEIYKETGIQKIEYKEINTIKRAAVVHNNIPEIIN